jgi:hypothetical protein
MQLIYFKGGFVLNAAIRGRVVRRRWADSKLENPPTYGSLSLSYFTWQGLLHPSHQGSTLGLTHGLTKTSPCVWRLPLVDLLTQSATPHSPDIRLLKFKVQ